MPWSLQSFRYWVSTRLSALRANSRRAVRARVDGLDVEYFQNWDTQNFYACISASGLSGIFILVGHAALNPQWKFLAPGSPDWDAQHQAIYRNPRVDRIPSDHVPSSLPPLPPVPSGPFPRWRDYFLPKEPLPVTRFPAVANAVRRRTDQMLMVHVVLHEDLYETRLGDGEFHYLRAVFLDADEARRHAAENQNEWARFHLRQFALTVTSGCVAPSDYEPLLYDHFHLEEVLEQVEARLGGSR